MKFYAEISTSKVRFHEIPLLYVMLRGLLPEHQRIRHRLVSSVHKALLSYGRTVVLLYPLVTSQSVGHVTPQVLIMWSCFWGMLLWMSLGGSHLYTKPDHVSSDLSQIICPSYSSEGVWYFCLSSSLSACLFLWGEKLNKGAFDCLEVRWVLYKMWRGYADAQYKYEI